MRGVRGCQCQQASAAGGTPRNLPKKRGHTRDTHTCEHFQVASPGLFLHHSSQLFREEGKDDGNDKSDEGEDEHNDEDKEDKDQENTYYHKQKPDHL